MRGRSVIGAGREPYNVGHAVLRNLLAHEFAGPVYPVNRSSDHVAGVRAVAAVEQIEQLPQAIWLAGEAAAIQRLRRHFFEVRGLSRAVVNARGYWKHTV